MFHFSLDDYRPIRSNLVSEATGIDSSPSFPQFQFFDHTGCKFAAKIGGMPSVIACRPSGQRVPGRLANI
jgi:hypothetical protein